jgi:hypothetical protein
MPDAQSESTVQCRSSASMLAQALPASGPEAASIGDPPSNSAASEPVPARRQLHFPVDDNYTSPSG